MLTTTHDTRVALGSPFTLLLVHNDGFDATALLRELWITIFGFEKQCSRFLPESELTQFNLHAGVRQPISPEFHALLTAAQQMAQLTDGLFNPFILPALQRAGYLQSLVTAHAADSQVDFRDRAVVSPDKLQLGADWAEIPYNTALDMGGCGKGFLGDLLAGQMTKYMEISYWFSLGGDVVCSGHDVAGDSWKVHIADTPDDINTCRQCFVAPETGVLAVATSGTNQRAGVTNGKRWHHILDPATGEPSKTDMVRASVEAATLLEADVLASCAIVKGMQQAPLFLRHAGAQGYALKPSSTSKSTVRYGTCVPCSEH